MDHTAKPAKRTVELTDPRALRAIAHPLRLALIGLLRREGAMTATQASTWLGEAPQKLTYHLGQLARYGLVEEAGGGHGRERPWRATAGLTEWASLPEGEEMAAASRRLEAVVAGLYFDLLRNWLQRKSDEPAEWQEAAIMSDDLLVLTPAGMARFGAELRRLLDRYGGETDPAQRPEGARPVNLICLGLPSVPSPDSVAG